MSSRAHTLDATLFQNEAELVRRILLSFASRARRLPPRPRDFDRTIVIVRKDIVPFYHAIYDHARGRFIELHVPKPGAQSGVLVIPVPPEHQPPVLGGRPMEG